MEQGPVKQGLVRYISLSIYLQYFMFNDDFNIIWVVLILNRVYIFFSFYFRNRKRQESCYVAQVDLTPGLK